MDDRLEWFKCRQSLLLGALAAMEPDEGYLYCIIIFRIYEVNGPCPDDARALALRTHMPLRRVNAALEKLMSGAKPKIEQVAGGFINGFADAEIDERGKLRTQAAEHGKKGAAKRWEKTKEKQHDGHRVGHATAMVSDDDKELEIESTSPKGDDAAASRTELFPVALAEPVYSDAKHELWAEGTAILEQLGLNPKRSRPMIGRWLRDTKNDAVTVMGAIRRARDARVVDPVPWITRAISTGTPPARSAGGGNGFASLLARRMKEDQGEDTHGEFNHGVTIDVTPDRTGGPRGDENNLFTEAGAARR